MLITTHYSTFIVNLSYINVRILFKITNAKMWHLKYVDWQCVRTEQTTSNYGSDDTNRLGLILSTGTRQYLLYLVIDYCLFKNN